MRDADRQRARAWAATTCASRRLRGGARRARTSTIRSRCASRPAVRRYELVPLMDDQELDSRASVGTIYWEGAVRAARDGARGRPRLPRAHRLRRRAQDLTARSAGCVRARGCAPRARTRSARARDTLPARLALAVEPVRRARQAPVATDSRCGARLGERARGRDGRALLDVGGQGVVERCLGELDARAEQALVGERGGCFMTCLLRTSWVGRCTPMVRRTNTR